MDDLYKHKYRIPSARLHSWDYGTNGAYFVTICTHERHHAFGKVRDGDMQLNAAGKIAAEIWQLIPEQFPYVVLDEFVVMPNHMHGLLYIDKIIRTDAINRVSTIINRVCTAANPDSDENQAIGGITGAKNPMLHENLSRIIRWYKGRTSFEIRKCNDRDAIDGSGDAINRVCTGNFAW